MEVHGTRARFGWPAGDGGPVVWTDVTDAEIVVTVTPDLSGLSGAVSRAASSFEAFSVAVDISAGGIRTFARWCGLPLGARVVDRARPTGGRLRLAVALGAAITLASVTVHP